jgi:hypothetical protein
MTKTSIPSLQTRCTFSRVVICNRKGRPPGSAFPPIFPQPEAADGAAALSESRGPALIPASCVRRSGTPAIPGALNPLAEHPPVAAKDPEKPFPGTQPEPGGALPGRKGGVVEFVPPGPCVRQQ